MTLKELSTILKSQKYPQVVIEKRTEEFLAIPQELFKIGKVKSKNDIIQLLSKHNRNNLNLFPKVREIYKASKS